MLALPRFYREGDCALTGDTVRGAWPGQELSLN